MSLSIYKKLNKDTSKLKKIHKHSHRNENKNNPKMSHIKKKRKVRRDQLFYLILILPFLLTALYDLSPANLTVYLKVPFLFNLVTLIVATPFLLVFAL